MQPRCAVPFYRFLYNTVGQDYLWWLRRAAPDAEIAAILAHPAVSVHVLYAGGQPAGFYELDRRAPHGINLSYFGLMPFAVGKRLGAPFLRHAVDAVDRVDQRLGGERPHPALDPRAERADREEAGRDGDAEAAGGRIAGEDRPGHRSPFHSRRTGFATRAPVCARRSAAPIRRARYSRTRNRLPISPTMPRRKASTQATKIAPWITVTQAPISAR